MLSWRAGYSGLRYLNLHGDPPEYPNRLLCALCLCRPCLPKAFAAAVLEGLASLVSAMLPKPADPSVKPVMLELDPKLKIQVTNTLFATVVSDIVTLSSMFNWFALLVLTVSTRNAPLTAKSPSTATSLAVLGARVSASRSPVTVKLSLTVSVCVTVLHIMPVNTSRLFVETVPVYDGFASGAVANIWA